MKSATIKTKTIKSTRTFTGDKIDKFLAQKANTKVKDRLTARKISTNKIEEIKTFLQLATTDDKKVRKETFFIKVKGQKEPKCLHFSKSA